MKSLKKISLIYMVSLVSCFFLLVLFDYFQTKEVILINNLLSSFVMITVIIVLSIVFRKR